MNSPGVAADLSHISTRAKAQGFLPANDGAKAAMQNADIIVIPAGIPRKLLPRLGPTNLQRTSDV